MKQAANQRAEFFTGVNSIISQKAELFNTILVCICAIQTIALIELHFLPKNIGAKTLHMLFLKQLTLSTLFWKGNRLWPSRPFLVAQY
jgi:hypothetical protein